uniref:Corticotropin-releasing factor domain-containing protein n=4 Tax=Seriola lalandi dorsalis TaxID=1841481 RepID=A0A3B4WSA7_SERLL
MKLNFSLWLVALLGVLPPPSAHCGPTVAPAGPRLPRPLLLRLGEEFSLRLGGGGLSSPVAAPDLFISSSSSSSGVNQALLQLTQRLLQVEQQQQEEEVVEEEKGKRSEEPPISLDLTFHLLREVLQMARAEQMAQQADSNRRMMDSFGK